MTTTLVQLQAPSNIGGTVQATNGTYAIPAGGVISVDPRDVPFLIGLGFEFVGGGGIELTDGETTVTGATALTITGGTVGGTTPNATLDISGGSRTVTQITIGSSPITLSEPFSDIYAITTGGTKGIETINLNNFSDYAESLVGLTVSFILADHTSGNDDPQISYSDGTVDLRDLQNGSVTFSCDGQNWRTSAWAPSTAPKMLAAGSFAVNGNSTASGEDSFAANGAEADAASSFAANSGNVSGGVDAAAFNHGHANQVDAFAIGTSTASGGGSFAQGQQTEASGQSAVTFGEFTEASGVDSIASGSSSTDRGIDTAQAYSSGPYSDLTVGTNQTIAVGLRGQTTDATPLVLTSDQVTPATNQDQLILVDNETLFADVRVLGKDAGTGDFLFSRMEVMIRRGTGAASTAIPTTTPTTPTVISTYATAGAISGMWAVSLSADTTNGALSVTVTGAADTAINWTAMVRSLEVVL